MPLSHRLGQVKSINIMTFSGAHGVGKSTLIATIQEAMEKDDLSEDFPYLNLKRQRFSVPSCSTAWFKATQEKLKAENKPFPVTYSDIDTMGFREQMQRELPVILRNGLMREVHQAAKIGSGFIFVDRWFGDIAAYTNLELGPERAAPIDSVCEEMYEDAILSLTALANNAEVEISLSHIFVPATSCAHAMPRGKTDDKSHRGTHPHEEWEQAYVRANRYTPPERTVTITASDRLQRVAEVFAGALD